MVNYDLWCRVLFGIVGRKLAFGYDLWIFRNVEIKNFSLPASLQRVVFKVLDACNYDFFV